MSDFNRDQEDAMCENPECKIHNQVVIHSKYNFSPKEIEALEYANQRTFKSFLH